MDSFSKYGSGKTMATVRLMADGSQLWRVDGPFASPVIFSYILGTFKYHMMQNVAFHDEGNVRYVVPE